MTAPVDNVVEFRRDRAEDQLAIVLDHLRTRARQALGAALNSRRPEALGQIPAGEIEPVIGPDLAKLWRVIATAQAGDDLELLAKKARCYDDFTFLDLMGEGFGQPETVAQDVLAAYRQYRGHQLAERIATTTDPAARAELAREIIELSTAGTGSALQPVCPAELAPPSELIPWLIEGYVARGDVTLLCGDAGSGKTWLADALALSVAVGRNLGGLPVLSPGETVLFVQEEQPDRLVAHRLHKLLAAAGVAPEVASPLRYLIQPGLNLMRDADLAALRAAVERERPALVIFDSLVRIMGEAKPDKAEESSAFFGRAFIPLARDYGCAVLIIHHMRKPSGSDDAGSLQHRIRNSSDIPAAVGSVLVLDRNGDTRTLWQTKCRWQPEQTPVGVAIEDVDHGVRVSVTGAAADAEVTILNALTDAGRDGMLRTELRSLLEDAGVRDTDKAATRILGKLKAKHRVFGLGSGKQGTRYWIRDHAPKEAFKAAE